MADYILFLDEANVTSTNPFFCLGGIIIKRDEYENVLIPSINALKIKYFSETSVLFHYTDMKKNKGDFKKLMDGNIRVHFWNEFNNILKNIDFVTIGSYLEYNTFQETFNPVKNKHYSVAFIDLVNNYITYLRSQKKAMGSIIVESRQWKENADIQEVFHDIAVYGTALYSSEECSQYLSTIGFIIKKDNCVGLQIADFVPDTFVRTINGSNNFYNVSNNFINKMFSINGKYQNIVGLHKLF